MASAAKPVFTVQVRELVEFDRLAKIVNDPERPVQIVFAGKAHPDDEPGKKDGWESGELPWKALREHAVKNYRMLKEGQPSSAFGQLLRNRPADLAGPVEQRRQA